jgi:hypothetical protein
MNILPEISAYVDGVSVAGSTMLGSNNCFSLRGTQGLVYRVLNFKLENLDRAMHAAGIDFPIKLGVYGRGTLALVMDPRLDQRFYEEHLCEVCCPREMLPLTQRLRVQLEIERGKRLIVPGGEWVNYLSK